LWGARLALDVFCLRRLVQQEFILNVADWGWHPCSRALHVLG